MNPTSVKPLFLKGIRSQARSILSASVFVGFVGSIFGQGSFQNLDFDCANPVSDPNSYAGWGYTTSSALPGWTVYMGNESWPYVYWNVFTTGQAAVSLIGPGSMPSQGIFPIGADYSVEITGGAIPLGSEDVNTSIAQTGIIPENAQSVQFYESGGTPLVVSFDGTVLLTEVVSTTLSSAGDPFTSRLYGADVTPYQGQSGQLEFTSVGFNPVELGDISFSPMTIPEPDPVFLGWIGGLTFLIYSNASRLRGMLHYLHNLFAAQFSK